MNEAKFKIGDTVMYKHGNVEYVVDEVEKLGNNWNYKLLAPCKDENSISRSHWQVEPKLVLVMKALS